MSLHMKFIKMHVAGRMAYRADFFLSVFAFVMFQTISPIIVGVVYYSGGMFPGWSLAQMLLLQGSASLIHGFSFMLFFGILWTTQDLTRQGRFDLLLIRPVDTLRLLIMESFDSEDIGQFIGGAAIVVLALFLLGGWPGPWYSVLLYLLLLLVGVAFYFALALFITAITMRVINTGRLYEFVDIITIFGRHPRSVYPKGLALVFTTVLPLLAVGHYPASVVLGMSMSGVLITTLSVLAFVLLALWVWRGSIRWYSSAGG